VRLLGRLPGMAVLAAMLVVGLGPVALAGPDVLAFVDVRSDFTFFDPNYLTKHEALAQRMTALKQQVFALELAGRPMVCAHQLLAEASWRLSSTADWSRIEDQLSQLARLVAHPETDRTPDYQNPTDGSWGRCLSAWFFRLDTSYNHIADLAAAGEAPPYSPLFLDRVNDPTRLQEYLSGIALSDIAHEGIDHRRELNNALADLMRLILKDEPSTYHWDERLKTTLMSLILGPLRDPASGFWGETYRRGNTKVHVQDLGMTFHVIRYLHGEAPDWPKVTDTLLAIKGLPYPQGWMRGNSYLTHDLYDVVALMHMGWAHASGAQQAAMGKEIGSMLRWCLTNTVRPDGSVVVMADDDSVEAATYNAVSFLHEIGYFTRAERFWTGQDFPAASHLASKLKNRISAALASGAGGEGGGYYRSALQKLGSE